MREFLLGIFPGHSAAAMALLDWRLWLVLMVAITLATTVHEFGHAWMADRLGDPTPRQQGRVTLSPLSHLDPLGTLLMGITLLIGFPIGWGKPVKTDPTHFKCGAGKGMALVAVAGPVMNFVLALALAPLARAILGTGLEDLMAWVAVTVLATILINLSLMCFNLVPVHPLDGSHIVAGLLPEKASEQYRTFMQHYGVYVFLGLLASGVLGKIIAPLVIFLFRLLVGL